MQQDHGPTPDIAPSSSLVVGLDDIPALDGSTGYSYQDGSGGGTALAHQQGHRCGLMLSFHITFGGNADPGCSGTTDSDMILGSSQIWMLPLSQVAVQVTQVSTAPVTVWSSDINMAPALGHLCGL